MATKTTRKKAAPIDDTSTEMVKCAFCQGKGIDPFPVLSPRSDCVVCNGRGVVRIRAPYVACQACAGTGVYTGTHMYCWTCRGKGVVHVHARSEKGGRQCLR